MGRSRLEAFSDGVLYAIAQELYVAVALMWLVPDRRIETVARGWIEHPTRGFSGGLDSDSGEPDET